MKCSKCGNEIADGMKFCNRCGTAIDIESINKANYKKRFFSIFNVINNYSVNNAHNEVAKGVNKCSLVIWIIGKIISFIMLLIIGVFCLGLLAYGGSKWMFFGAILIAVLGFINYCFIKFIFGFIALLVRAKGEQIELLEEIKNNK